MQLLIKLICITLLQQLSLSGLFAQENIAAAMEQIYKAYSSSYALSFTGKMKMYVKGNPSKIIEALQSSYAIKESNFFCTTGLVQLLMNDDYYVSVDKALRLIVVGYKRDIAETYRLPVLNLASFRKYLGDGVISGTVKRQDNLVLLQLNDPKVLTGCALYNIIYDSKKGYLKKVTMEMSDHYNTSNKVMVLEINYTAPVIIRDGSKSFSEKPFFSIVNNKIRLAHAYKNYQLINQL